MIKKGEGLPGPSTSTAKGEGSDTIKHFRGLLKSWKEGRNPDISKYQEARKARAIHQLELQQGRGSA